MSRLKELLSVATTLKVLFVENDEKLRSETIKMLSSFFKFSDIVTAVDGKDGLEKFKVGSFNIIISEMDMPNMNGISMLNEIRKLDADIPFIVLSERKEMDYFIKTIQLGVDGYLLKPLDIRQFNQIVSKILRQVKIKQEHDEYKLSLESQYKLLKQKKLEILQYSDAIDSVAIVTKTDLKGNITFANQMFSDVSGYSNEELIGQPHNIVRSPDVPKEVYKDMWDTIQRGEEWTGVIKNKAKDGSTYFVKSYVIPLFNDDLTVDEYMGIRILVTNEETQKKELRSGLLKNVMEQKQRASKLEKENKSLKSELDKVRSLTLSSIGSESAEVNYLKDVALKYKEQIADLKSFNNSLETELKALRYKLDHAYVQMSMGHSAKKRMEKEENYK